MSILTSPGARVDDFFLKPSSHRPLALFRIAFGLFAFTEMVSLRPNWLDLFGKAGIIQWVISKEIFASDALPHLASLHQVFASWGAADADATVCLVAAAYLVAVLALTLGFFTRCAAIAACALHTTIWNTGALYGYGVESFTRVCLFYCIFMPVARCWSLDARTSKREDSCQDSWQATLSFRVLQLHLCIVYLAAGLAKIQGEQWRNGEAMWRLFAQPEYARFEMPWLAHFPWLLWLMGWSVLVLEIGYAIFIWPRATRPFFLAGILALHAGIALFMGLWGFAVIMILMNLAAFGPGLVISRQADRTVAGFATSG